MPENTFDIVAKIDLAEVSNAIHQATREIDQRYDLKNTKSTIELNEKDHKILLASQDDYKLKVRHSDRSLGLGRRNAGAWHLPVAAA